MVICLESYVEAIGEKGGISLEEQVLITRDGYEMLNSIAIEQDLLS